MVPDRRPIRVMSAANTSQELYEKVGINGARGGFEPPTRGFSIFPVSLSDTVKVAQAEFELVFFERPAAFSSQQAEPGQIIQDQRFWLPFDTHTWLQRTFAIQGLADLRTL